MIILIKPLKNIGWKNIKHEILFENLSKEEAEEKEIELIALYKSDQRQFGYNIDHGGSCVGRMSEETKRKLSETHKGINTSPVVKYSMSGELLEKYNGVIEAGKKNNLFHSAISACCRNISKTAGGYIWRYLDDPITQEHIDKCNSDGLDFRRNAICQYSMNGVFVAEYESAEYAQKEYGYCATNIRRCCKGKQRTNQGYIWRYANDIPTEEYIQWCNNALEDKKVSVSQYSLKGELIEIFNSMTEAFYKTGVTVQRIHNCCCGLNKTSGGFIWRYKDDVLTKEQLKHCNNKPSKKVVQYSINNEFLKEWESASKAAEFYEFEDPRNIRACCRGKQKTAYGYIWKYANEEGGVSNG